ncbi:hypothetical protein D3C83_28810 [compost metagenome]
MDSGCRRNDERYRSQVKDYGCARVGVEDDAGVAGATSRMQRTRTVTSAPRLAISVFSSRAAPSDAV